MTNASKLPSRLSPLAEFDMPDGYTWLAIVPFGWAKDDDLGKAVRKACKNGGRIGVRRYSPSRGWLTIVVAPATAILDHFGRIVDEPEKGYGDGRSISVAHWDEDNVCTKMLPDHIHRALLEIATASD